MIIEENEVIDNNIEATPSEDDVMNLFPTNHDIDDSVEEVTEETEETEEVVEEEKTIDSFDDLEVKFLHETKTLKDFSKDDIKNYVQKGMNQNRLQERADKDSETVSEILEVAELFDLDIKGMKDILLEQHFNNKAESEGRNIDDVKKEFENGRKSRSDKMYDRFLKSYPDIKVDELPETVLESVKNGSDLNNVYKEHLNNTKLSEKDTEITTLKSKVEELESKIKVTEQNKSTKKKSVIKKTSNSNINDTNDDFLIGLLGD